MALFRSKPNKTATVERIDYVPIDTPAFRRWFDGSKVVDKDGDPLVVWHGSPAAAGKFDVFDFSKAMDVGMHFGTLKAATETIEKIGGIVRPFYLRILNPFEAEDPVNWIDASGELGDALHAQLWGYPMRDGRDLTQTIYDMRDAEFYRLWWEEGIDGPEYFAYRSEASRLIRDTLEFHGFDGVVYTNENEDKGSLSWIALRPNQIKSADENVGTFDLASDDVRKNPSRRTRRK